MSELFVSTTSTAAEATTDVVSRTGAPAELKRRSVHGATIIYGSQALLLVANLLATTILARLLLPEHFGLITMVTSLLIFFQILKDAGLSTAIVQQPALTRGQLNAIFWLNLALGMLLTIAFAACGPIIAWFYREPKVVPLTIALAGAFLLDALTSAHGALLQRRLEFGWSNFAGVVSQLSGLILAISMAWSGWGAWSLVAQQLTPKVVAIPFVWYAARWLPGSARGAAGVWRALRFAGGITGFNIVHYFARNFDNVLIGYRLGSIALGVYSRAYLLFMLPLQQLTYPLSQVVMPALARLADDRDRFRTYYVNAIYFLAAVALPMTGALLAVPHRIVGALLGGQWTQAAGLLQLLACMLPMQILMSSAGWVCVATGRSNRFFWLGLVNAVASVAGFSLGLWAGGMKGLIVGYVVATWLVGPIWNWIAWRPTSIRLRDVVLPCSRLAPHAALAVVAALIIDRWLAHATDFTALMVESFVATLVYVGGIWLVGEHRRMRALLKLEALRHAEAATAGEGDK